MQVAELNTGVQPCEPKPRPAEARRIYKSPFLTGLAPRASAREQHSADRSRACELKQRALFLNKANAACGGEPGDSRSANRRAVRLRPAQLCELQNRRTTKNGDRTTTRKQLFLINPPAPLRRQRTAESTCTTLVQAVACTSPSVKLPKAKIIKTERTPTGEHLRLKSCRQAKTPYDRPSPSPAKSAARGIDKSSNLPFRGTFYTIGSSISVILITQMDFLIINSVQNLRGGGFFVSLHRPNSTLDVRTLG